jgi:hypothetical protein
MAIRNRQARRVAAKAIRCIDHASIVPAGVRGQLGEVELARLASLRGRAIAGLGRVVMVAGDAGSDLSDDTTGGIAGARV